ncbi:hypothetical protein [Asticcacaulis sp.]|uniref:hypothetical protein n=1 Tax=Asticcacaulis sp. TaxID=1872648 RepID=UPI002615E7FC|nr:hypothetical protein [Asticcacaulis sp.]
MTEETQIPADTDPANAIHETAEITPEGADIDAEDDPAEDEDMDEEGLEEDEDDLTPLDKDTGADLDADALSGQDEDREYDVSETIEKTTGI